MDLVLILRELEASLSAVMNGDSIKIQRENDQVKITTYRVGSIVRVDIKEK
jgi:hypothetical protein